MAKQPNQKEKKELECNKPDFKSPPVQFTFVHLNGLQDTAFDEKFEHYARCLIQERQLEERKQLAKPKPKRVRVAHNPQDGLQVTPWDIEYERKARNQCPPDEEEKPAKVREKVEASRNGLQVTKHDDIIKAHAIELARRNKIAAENPPPKPDPPCALSWEKAYGLQFNAYDKYLKSQEGGSGLGNDEEKECPEKEEMKHWERRDGLQAYKCPRWKDPPPAGRVCM